MTVIDHTTGEIVSEGGFQVLDPRVPAGVRPGARPGWIATISAGYRAEDGTPRVSRDGRIHLHDPDGQAAGLREALAETEYRGLTIAFADDDLPRVIHQAYKRRGKTRLEAYGDGLAMHELTGGEWQTYAVGSAAYEECRASCKVEFWVLFVLARWVRVRPQLYFPDGFGSYRLRFTSQNSISSLVGSIQQLLPFTSWRLAGIPLELAITMREVATPDGTYRRVPVWTVAFRPPEVIQLTSGNFRSVVDSALAEGRALHLLPAAGETSAEDLDEEADVDLDEAYVEDAAPSTEEIERIQVGDPPADAAAWNRRWHQLVAGSDLEDDDARHGFLTEYTEGRTGSLWKYLGGATEGEAAALCAAAARAIGKAMDEEESGVESPKSKVQGPSHPDVISDARDPLWRRWVGQRSLARKGGLHPPALELPIEREDLERAIADVVAGLAPPDGGARRPMDTEQLRAIRELAKDQGLNDRQLDGLAEHHWSAPVARLTHGQAGRLILLLQENGPGT